MTHPGTTFFRLRPKEDLDWMDQASCRGCDMAMFYPNHGAHSHHAKRVCDDCPVRAACLDYALTHREWGVWGGTDDADRDTIRRKLRNRRRMSS